MPLKKKTNIKKHETFKVGDCVGAKVRGHRIWPGIVVEVENSKIKVKFFGTGDFGTSFHSIKPFSQMTASELAGKGRIQDAIEQCRAHIQAENAKLGNQQSQCTTNNEPLPIQKPKIKKQKAVKQSEPIVKSESPDDAKDEIVKEQHEPTNNNEKEVKEDQDKDENKQEEEKQEIISASKLAQQPVNETKIVDSSHLEANKSDDGNCISSDVSSNSSARSRSCSEDADINNKDSKEVDDENSKLDALNKLKRKVENKLRDKQSKKEQILEKKLKIKFDEKLSRSINILDSIFMDLSLIHELATQQSIIKTKTVDSTIERFTRNTPGLLKLINYILKNDLSETKTSKDYQSKIKKIVRRFGELRKNDLISADYKKKLKLTINSFKKRKEFNQFILSSKEKHVSGDITSLNLENYNAMIELKANEA